jgi:23S rRNA pseudouridine2457 synthase
MGLFVWMIDALFYPQHHSPTLIRSLPRMPRLILLNKPYGVLSQFTDRDSGRKTLADYLELPKVRPAGRLDYDSEGLLLLTDSGQFQAQIADPRHKMAKLYWAQVEGVPDESSLERLRSGLLLNDGPTRPAQAKIMEEPAQLWSRDPPIRYRAAIPTSWIELTLKEGRNRQVRRMTAAVGHPTLRLIRAAIGPWTLESLAPGQWRETILDATHFGPALRKPGPPKPGYPASFRKTRYL